MKNGRGYVIRLYNEKYNEALFFNDSKGIIGTHNWKRHLKEATIFDSSEEASEKIVSLAKGLKRRRRTKGGYMYISKAFYKEKLIAKTWNAREHVRKVPTSLTKPDRNDFLKAL